MGTLSDLDDLDLEAKELLRDAGYLWDDHLYAFRRTRGVDRQTTEEYLASKPVVIAFEELYDHHLVGGDSHSREEQPTASERLAALGWLRERVAEFAKL